MTTIRNWNRQPDDRDLSLADVIEHAEGIRLRSASEDAAHRADRYIPHTVIDPDTQDWFNGLVWSEVMSDRPGPDAHYARMTYLKGESNAD